MRRQTNLDEAMKSLNRSDKSVLEQFQNFVYQELVKEMAPQFHLSEKDFAAILDGKLEVSHVVYHNNRRQLLLKRLTALAIVVLFVLLLAVPDLADNIRLSLIRFFACAN